MIQNNKNNRIIVTSGKNYIDIDAYASCFVYANILNYKGINAIPVSTASLNESIPETIFNKNEKFYSYYEHKDNDKFIILDVSSPQFFDSIVEKKDIIEIVDHHFGYEDYWTNILGKSSIIETIGAVATIITEYAVETNYIEIMSQYEVKLLMAAILDNTLNFKAQITTDRDKNAYNILKRKINISSFDKFYFNECEKTIINDIAKTIKLDTKIEKVSNLLPSIISQFIIWDFDTLKNKINEICTELEKIGEDWMCNIIELEKGYSYILCANSEPKKKIENIFNKNYNNSNILKLDRLYLRKEIIKLVKDMDDSKVS